MEESAIIISIVTASLCTPLSVIVMLIGLCQNSQKHPQLDRRLLVIWYVINVESEISDFDRCI